MNGLGKSRAEMLWKATIISIVIDGCCQHGFNCDPGQTIDELKYVTPDNNEKDTFVGEENYDVVTAFHRFVNGLCYPVV